MSFSSLLVNILILANVKSESLFARYLKTIFDYASVLGSFETVIERIALILQNPRSYARELVILIAILFLLFMLLLLLGMLVIALKRYFKLRKAFLNVPIKITREQFTRFLSHGIILLIVAAALFTASISIPSLCANCHTIKKSFNQWKSSSHKHISCAGCHYEPGLYGYISGSIHGTENLLAHVFKAPTPMQSLTANKTCLNCHDDINDKMVISKKQVKIKHKEITAAGFPCTDCHNSTAHSSKNEKPFAMNICTKCHDGAVVKAECTTCHTKDVAYKPHIILDDWPKTKTARIICAGCHSKKTDQSCILCHEVELPHSDEFRRTHSRRAESDKNLCYKCHWNTMSKTGMCSCHKDGKMHGSYERWYFKHRETARINGIGCNCHAAIFCGRCHNNPKTIYPSTFSGTIDEGMH